MAGLTDTACRQAKPKDKAYKLSDRDGLYLHVQKSGRKTWRKKFRYRGREQIYTIGE